MSDWQPIETVRYEEDRPVILIDDRDPESRPVVGWWEENHHGQYEWRDCGDMGCNGQVEYNPTHWMEVPKRPQRTNFTGLTPECPSATPEARA